MSNEIKIRKVGTFPGRPWLVTSESGWWSTHATEADAEREANEAAATRVTITREGKA